MKACCREYLLGQFDNDEEVVGEIYAEYVSSLSQKLDEIDQALAAGDFTAIDRTAHAIKGNSLAAGDQAVADTAISTRNAAKLQDADEVKALLAKLRELFEEL